MPARDTSSICPTRTRQQGYGLIVIAALFTAFAVIAATALNRNSTLAELNQQQAARAQLTRLTNALAQYAVRNGDRFPCPAAYDVGYNNAQFGSPVATTCHNDVTAPAGTSFLGGTTRLIRGMVPVRALIPYGIGLNDAFDPWGSRIMMIVSRDVTINAPSVIIADADLPIVTDYITGEIMTPPPTMMLISYGKDRFGGYLRNQSSLSNPALACQGGGSRRMQNCQGTRDYLIGPWMTTSTTSADKNNYFDDLISALYFKPSTGSTCIVDGVTTGGNAANCCNSDADADGICGNQSCTDECGNAKANNTIWCSRSVYSPTKTQMRCTNNTVTDIGTAPGCNGGYSDACP